MTLRALVSLIEDLFQEGYNYVLTARFQIDPVERRFSRYRQMNGGNFLVSLREVCNSEKILLIQGLVRERLDFWKDVVIVFNPQDYQMNDSFQKEIEEISNDLHASKLSASTQEVSYYIAGYTAHQIQKMVKCTNVLRKCWQKTPQVSTSVTSIHSHGVDWKNLEEDIEFHLCPYTFDFYMIINLFWVLCKE